MNKRGQFYIIAALIIAAIIAGLVSEANYAIRRPKPVKFYDLSKDYETEVTKIIDSGVYLSKGDDWINEAVANFTKKFLEYAQEKDPNLQLLYLYGNRDEITVVNYAQGDAEIEIPEDPSKNQIISGGGAFAESEVNIEIGETTFTRSIKERMEYFKDISTNIKFGGGSIKVIVAGIAHDFDLTKGDIIHYIVETESNKEIHIVRSSEFGEVA